MVIKLIAFKVLFTITAYFNLDIDQIDVKTLFLYEFIDQLIYMDIPKDFRSKATLILVWKSPKAFYSLK